MEDNNGVEILDKYRLDLDHHKGNGNQVLLCLRLIVSFVHKVHLQQDEKSTVDCERMNMMDHEVRSTEFLSLIDNLIVQ